MNISKFSSERNLEELIESLPRDRLKMYKLYKRDRKVLKITNQINQTEKY
jgi:hypothetical protein